MAFKDDIYGYGPEKDEEGKFVPVTWGEWMAKGFYRGIDEAVEETGWSREEAIGNALSPSQQGILYSLREGRSVDNDDAGWADETEWKGLTEKVDGKWQLTELGQRVAKEL